MKILIVVLSLLPLQLLAADRQLQDLALRLFNTVPYRCDTVTVEAPETYRFMSSIYPPGRPVFPGRPLARASSDSSFLIRSALFPAYPALAAISPTADMADSITSSFLLPDSSRLILYSTGKPIAPTGLLAWRQNMVLSVLGDSLAKYASLVADYKDRRTQGVYAMIGGAAFGGWMIYELQHKERLSGLEEFGAKAGVVVFGLDVILGLEEIISSIVREHKADRVGDRLRHWTSADTRRLMEEQPPGGSDSTSNVPGD